MLGLDTFDTFAVCSLRVLLGTLIVQVVAPFIALFDALIILG